MLTVIGIVALGAVPIVGPALLAGHLWGWRVGVFVFWATIWGHL